MSISGDKRTFAKALFFVLFVFSSPALAFSMAHSVGYSLNPGRVEGLSWRLCIYSAPICLNVWCVSAVYRIVHYKEPLKSFDKSRV